MTYVLPQVLVYQDYSLTVAAGIQPLAAFIFGGHAHLQRYDDADEKAESLLGTYDHVGTLIDGEYKTCYDWPGRPTGAQVDFDYTRLFIDNALLRYFRDTSLTITRPATGVIRLPGTNFKENPDDPTTYPRDSDLLDRDVAVGDIAVLSGDDGAGGDTLYLSTYVKAVLATDQASSVGTATAYASNSTAGTEAASSTAGASNSGDANIDSEDASAYDGLEDGVVSETYTVTVIQGSTGGDPETARLQITSASGLDDIAEYTPAADVFGVTSSDPALAPQPMPVGTRGGTITFTASDAAYDPTTAFTLGDTWTVEFEMDYAVPTASAAGTGTDYSGTQDTTYIVEVTKGGAYGTAEVTVTTTDGYDYGAAAVVPATPATDFAVGTKGVVMNFSNTATGTLVYGDRWYIAATAEAAGNYDRLRLGTNPPAGMTANITLDLYIKKNIEVAAEHVAIPGQYNWTQADTEICVYGGIQAYDETWTDSGVPVALDVITDSHVGNSNKMYVEYRAWESTLAGSVNGISDSAALDDAVSGAIDPDNPLKYALYLALQNNNGRNIWYLAVADPSDDTEWSNALEKIEDRTDVYGLVPLTRDNTVIGLCQGHVAAQSTEIADRWRVLWVSLSVDSEVSVLTEDDSGDPLLGTTADDPDATGTQYTLFTCDEAEFETDGVRAGDVVRYQYTTDAFGNVTYTEYVIDEVVNQNTLRLTTGTDVAEVLARKFEIWRTRTNTELATAIGAAAGAYADRRVRAVWPDTITVGSDDVEGYFLCAALAALVSGVPPHQGLTHLEIIGFDSVSRTVDLFSRTQLDSMAEAGTWIVTQNPDGDVYTRHAVTTADYVDINAREEMVVRNVDSISYFFMDRFSPYIGIANVTPSMLKKIKAETNLAISYLQQINYSELLGGQLIDGEITDLRVSPVFADRIVLGVSLDIPYALNNLEVHLII